MDTQWFQDRVFGPHINFKTNNHNYSKIGMIKQLRELHELETFDCK